MLHRGIYAIDGEKKLKTDWSFKAVLGKLVGITPEYTRGDKAIAWGVFLYSFVYGFVLAFAGVVVWNVFQPWPVKWWSW